MDSYGDWEIAKGWKQQPHAFNVILAGVLWQSQFSKESESSSHAHTENQLKILSAYVASFKTTKQPDTDKMCNDLQNHPHICILATN